MKGHTRLSLALKWPLASVPNTHPSSTRTLKARCVKRVTPSATRQRRTFASRALVLHQNVTRTIPRAPSGTRDGSDLGCHRSRRGRTQATKTAARTRIPYLLAHDVRSRLDGLDKEFADASTRRPEETPVCTGGAQRAGANRRELPGCCTLIHRLGRQSRPGTRRR